MPAAAAGKARPLLLACIVGCLASACGSAANDSAPGPPTPTASTPAPPASIVALGDSVPRGTNCSCTPFPALTATDLTAGTKRAVTATNDSVAGYKTSDVLAQLSSDQSVEAHVAAADILEIEIGANDVGYSSACGTDVSCYTPKLPALEKNLGAIVARVRELAAGRKSLVVLIDYWSVWLGGQYATAKGPAYVDAAETMTAKVNALIRSTAASTGSTYVDLRAAFKGPDYSYDETHYLSNDGDHPNAAGHQQIATAVDASLEAALGVR